MNLLRWPLYLGLASLSVVAAGAAAQQVTPRIGYVYPAGGRQGETVQVVVGGQFLDGVAKVYVANAGVAAKIVEYIKPISQGEFNKARDQLKALMDKRAAAFRKSRKRDDEKAADKKSAWTPADEKLVEELREKIAGFIKRPANPAIAETVKLEVTFSPGAAAGECELRLGTSLGLTNPLAFHVGPLTEFAERPEQARQNLAAAKFANRFGQQPKSRPAEQALKMTLPAVVNGQIMPGDVDRWQFTAHRGQQVVVAVQARQLIPYLADAVPGWFQATLALFDANGKEVAYDDDFRFNPDPVLHYEIPADGDYTVEIKDAIYRGREDFVYRLTIGELPFVTSIFPLGGRAGTTVKVELKGWNLPQDDLTPDVKAEPPGIQWLSVRSGGWNSNRVPFELNTLPECREQEPNDQAATAQAVSLPIIVNGRVERPGDRDLFRFEGHAGDEVVAETSARRLDSPLDSILKLTDATGRQLAVNDDHDDKGAGLTTHHADSLLRVKLPADGMYFVSVDDTQQKGGPDYGYRLRISPPQPDFALRLVPSSLNARPGLSVPVTAYALRRDGFAGDIRLALQDAPKGFSLSGALIPAGQDRVTLTVAAPPESSEEPVALQLEGRAEVGGRELRRRAVPAEDMMQAFFYRHLVPAKDLLVVVGASRGRLTSSVRRLEEKPLQLAPGGTAQTRYGLPGRAVAGQFQLELSDPPEGITLEKVTPSADNIALAFHADKEKVKPGTKGNLIVEIVLDRSGAAKPQANRRRTAVAVLPAIPFEVTGPDAESARNLSPATP